MIKTIKIVNYLGDSLTIDMFNPALSGFAIEEVSGFGPVKASINTTQFANADGGIFTSSRCGNRNLVFKLMLMPGEENGLANVEQARLLTYKYFQNKRAVKMIFETDERECYIDGIVEDNKPTTFYKGTNIKGKYPMQQVSVICNQPYFMAMKKVNTTFNGVNAMFEFPFSNESLTEKLINFGEIVTYSERSVYYEGDAKVGMLIKIHAIGDVRGFTIYDMDTRGRIAINDERFYGIMGTYIQFGDEITISTVKGNKYITLLRDGIKYNILNALDKDPDWFELDKGDNLFAYAVTSGIENVQLRIENDILYEGI